LFAVTTVFAMPHGQGSEIMVLPATLSCVDCGGVLALVGEEIDESVRELAAEHRAQHVMRRLEVEDSRFGDSP
jgi:hypothetical protein